MSWLTNQYWNYENFKNWAKKSKLNSVYANVGEYSLIVPMHLYLNNIGQTNDMGGFVNVGNYPVGR